MQVIGKTLSEKTEPSRKVKWEENFSENFQPGTFQLFTESMVQLVQFITV